MNIRLVKSSWDTTECDVLIIPMFEDEEMTEGFPAALNERLSGLLEELRRTEEWKAKPGEMTVLYRPNQLKAARLILLGAGKSDSYDSHSIRTLIMQAVRKVKGYNLKRVAVFRRSQVQPTLAAQAAVEGVVLATYDGDDYKTEGRSKNFIEEILFLTDQQLATDEIEKALKRGQILAEASNLARRLVNEPANQFSPSRLAELARETAERFGLEVEILGEPEMEEREMAAILAVAQGSDEPARFIVLKHFGASDPEAPPIVLVGKGVTFDSGGLSLKPAQSMEEMKCDKAGACAVLAAIQAIAQLQIKKNVVALIPAVENLPSGRAQRPGDVVRSMSGKTIEVINTDAEGRLILADALHVGRQLQPEYMVDIATLTGACVVAWAECGLDCSATMTSCARSSCRRESALARDSGDCLWTTNTARRSKHRSQTSRMLEGAGEVLLSPPSSYKSSWETFPGVTSILPASICFKKGSRQRDPQDLGSALWWKWLTPEYT